MLIIITVTLTAEVKVLHRGDHNIPENFIHATVYRGLDRLTLLTSVNLFSIVIG